MTGRPAHNEEGREQLHSLSPASIDVETEPAPVGQPARNGKWGLYVGIASGLAAAAVLAFGSVHNTAAHVTPRSGRADITSEPAAAPALAAPPIADVAPESPQQPVAGAAAEPIVSHKHVAVAPRVARPVAEAPAPAASAGEGQTAEGPAFDHDAAMRAIAAVELKDCRDAAVGAGTTGVAVTFAPNGRVSLAVLEGPPVFNGTPVVGCIISHMRSVKIAPFAGDKVTVHTKAVVQ